MVKVSEDILTLKELIKNTFEAYCETPIFPLKVHMLDDGVEHVENFGSENTLSASRSKVLKNNQQYEELSV